MSNGYSKATEAILKDIKNEEAERDAHEKKAKEHEGRADRLFRAASKAIANEDFDGAGRAIDEAKKQTDLAGKEWGKAHDISQQIIGKCKAISILLASE